MVWISVRFGRHDSRSHSGYDSHYNHNGFEGHDFHDSQSCASL